jgi:hypothetical protein
MSLNIAFKNYERIMRASPIECGRILLLKIMRGFIEVGKNN